MASRGDDRDTTVAPVLLELGIDVMGEDILGRVYGQVQTAVHTP